MENLRLKYGNVLLPIQDGYNIEKSSNDVTYSDITCLWDINIEEYPERYQEVQIINIDTNKVKFFGYIDSYNFGELRETDVEVDINFTIFAPIKLTTLRTVIAVGTYDIKSLIENIILAPLVYDGFQIKQIDIDDRQVTVNYKVETIEYCLNNLSNKYNLWWYIDENKYIYIADISYITNKNPDHVYNDNERINGLEYLKPITECDNYANVINFKNLRTYQYSLFSVENGQIDDYNMPLINERVTNLKKDGEIIFNFPVDIKKENIIEKHDSVGEEIHTNIYALNMRVSYTDNSTDEIYIYVDPNNIYHQSSNLTKNNTDSDKNYSLIMDSFFSNLATGIIYNGSKTISDVTWLQSSTALVWNTNKFYDDKGIHDKKGKTSATGIVETTVDMNNSWKTIAEIKEIAKAYLEKNSLQYANKIELKLDTDTLKVGDVMKIQKFGIDNKYVITNIKEIVAYKETEYIATLQTTNMFGNFVDTFRTETTQYEEEHVNKVYITHYNNEQITQTTEVII